MVEAPTRDYAGMLADRKADLVAVVLPFALDPELQRIARPLFYNVVGVTQLLVWSARQSFLEKNRAAMTDFMEDTLRITRWFLDPMNRGEIAAIARRVPKQPPERLDWPFTQQDYYHDPTLRPNIDALQKNVAMMKDLGFVPTEIDVKKYTDLSFIDAASRRLK